MTSLRRLSTIQHIKADFYLFKKENNYFCLKIATHKECFCQIIPNFVSLQV